MSERKNGRIGIKGSRGIVNDDLYKKTILT